MQNMEAELGAMSQDEDYTSGDGLKPPVSHTRRQSTILEEISRQASVLWDDDGVTEAEDAATTDEDTAET